MSKILLSSFTGKTQGVNINEYLERIREGKLDRTHMAFDAAYLYLSESDIRTICKNPIFEDMELNGRYHKKPESEWDKKYLEFLLNASAAECFNEEYLLYLHKVGEFVKKYPNGKKNIKSKNNIDDSKNTKSTDNYRSGDSDEYFMENDTFNNAIKNKENGTLKALLIGIIRRDPTFATTEFDEAEKYIEVTSKKIHGSSLNLYEEYSKQEDEYEKKQSEWDKDYYNMILVWFRDNFSKERLSLIKKVGKEVYKNEPTLGKSKYNNRKNK